MHNSVVVFDGEMPPEGAAVQVQPLKPQDTTTIPGTVKPKTIWEELLDLQGQVPTLPQDAARNHDHYLYGTPKR
jgi:hypothetical protein